MPESHDETAHGLIVTLARYGLTWFSVVFEGPGFYATRVPTRQYSRPSEFFIVTLLVTGLASFGLGVTVSAAFEESRTGEDVGRYSLHDGSCRGRATAVGRRCQSQCGHLAVKPSSVVALAHRILLNGARCRCSPVTVTLAGMVRLRI